MAATTVKAAKQQLRASIAERISALNATTVLDQCQLPFTTDNLIRNCKLIRSQASQACQSVLALPQYRSAQRVGIYLSMEHKEIQTRELVVDALDNEKQVFVPFIRRFKDTGASVMDMFKLESLRDYESLSKDKWGIPSLARESLSRRENWTGSSGFSQSRDSETDASLATKGQVKGLDMLVMPGMAFDTHMNRLGHGKGYYDSFLKTLETLKEAERLQSFPFLVALALDVQLLPEDASVPTEPHDHSLDAIALGSGAVVYP